MSTADINLLRFQMNILLGSLISRIFSDIVGRISSQSQKRFSLKHIINRFFHLLRCPVELRFNLLPYRIWPFLFFFPWHGFSLKLHSFSLWKPFFSLTCSKTSLNVIDTAHSQFFCEKSEYDQENKLKDLTLVFSSILQTNILLLGINRLLTHFFNCILANLPPNVCIGATHFLRA